MGTSDIGSEKTLLSKNTGINWVGAEKEHCRQREKHGKGCIAVAESSVRSQVAGSEQSQRERGVDLMTQRLGVLSVPVLKQLDATDGYGK